MFGFRLKNGIESLHYYEYFNGHWATYKYDKNGNNIYYEHSGGYWKRRTYNENNECITLENKYISIDY